MGDDNIIEIEAEQSLLKKSIEEARRLSDRSDVLVRASRQDPRPEHPYMTK